MDDPREASLQGESVDPAGIGVDDGAVVVHASARLHLGFLDPGASLERRFGSIGMMIEGTATVVRLAPADVQLFGAGAHARHELDRARRIVAQLQSATRRHAPLEVRILEALPAHVGLGSGTQLALALGRAFSGLYGLGMSTPELARLLDRGGRSGIGIAGFDHGGVLVDGGPRSGAAAPPVLARFDFPEEWRIILAGDPALSGLHGEGEMSGIARLSRFPQHQAAHLCHQVLMMIMPALAEREFAPFAKGLSEVQRVLGEYFAPAQGGVYTSPGVGRLMRWIGEHHLAAVGQSSWGPTAFAILPSASQAQEVLASARGAGVVDCGIEANIVAGRNRGALLERGAGAGGTTGHQ
ncbi:MAG: beta-ribofuranosylaminobenzene 5'-phosphate synthase [Lautropia sp.]|nr:beta-ribofuranosylaminobenzene 5'-phosphate synthase [Lautropia sp.]